MKIVILQGSPNIHGSTHELVEAFTKGAKEKGHTIQRFDVSRMNIHPCIGCIQCGYDGPCVQKDDNEQIRNAIMDSDMVVFATPLYYYGMSAQLKTTIDRFCAYNFRLTDKNIKSALLSVAWNADDWTFDALEAHYKTLVRYLNLNDQGTVLGKGCGSVSMTKSSAYIKQAYDLGRNVD